MQTSLLGKCQCCDQPQARLFCGVCINVGLHLHRKVLIQSTRQVSRAVEAASDALGSGTSSTRGTNGWRRLRAEVARSKRRCETLTCRIEAVDALLKQGLGSRRQRLEAHLTPAGDMQEALMATHRLQLDVTRRLTEARRVLIREAVAVFGVLQSPMNGWEIAGIPLPSPDNFRLHRSTRINAALAHVLHLLSLMTRYLGVDLPFYPVQQRAHVGRPRMKANIPFIGTTRFHDEPVLWMSSTARVDTADKPKTQIKHRRFLTAFALLAHSVAYLAHTQGTTGVGIPIDSQPSTAHDARIPVWSILHLIDALAESPLLGGFSHEPGSLRSAPHMLYGLDVVKVVGSIIRSEERRWGSHKLDASDLSEGWDLMESAEGGLQVLKLSAVEQ